MKSSDDLILRFKDLLKSLCFTDISLVYDSKLDFYTLQAFSQVDQEWFCMQYDLFDISRILYSNDVFWRYI